MLKKNLPDLDTSYSNRYKTCVANEFLDLNSVDFKGLQFRSGRALGKSRKY